LEGTWSPGTPSKAPITVSRIVAVPAAPAVGALLDPKHPTVAWFGSQKAELRTVQDLQEAIGAYAVLGSDLRAALEADRTGRPDNLPSGPGTLQPVGPRHLPSARESRPLDPSTGRTLLELALIVGILAVIVVLALVAVIAGGPNS
jgi:hypothetical protein